MVVQDGHGASAKDKQKPAQGFLPRPTPHSSPRRRPKKKAKVGYVRAIESKRGVPGHSSSGSKAGPVMGSY